MSGLNEIIYKKCLLRMVFIHDSDVNAEPALNIPVLLNEILGCFSETTNQNCKSCSQSMCRGENIDL